MADLQVLRQQLNGALDDACAYISQVGRAVKRIDNVKMVLYMKRDRAKAALEQSIRDAYKQLLELHKSTEVSINSEMRGREALLRGTKVNLMQLIKQTASECTNIEELMEVGKEDNLTQFGRSSLERIQGLMGCNPEIGIAGITDFEYIRSQKVIAMLRDPSILGYLQTTSVAVNDVETSLDELYSGNNQFLVDKEVHFIISSGQEYVCSLLSNLSVQLQLPDHTVKDLHIIDCQNGQYDVCFIPDILGQHTLEIKLYGCNILGSPFSISIINKASAEAHDKRFKTPTKPRISQNFINEISKHIESNPPVIESLHSSRNNVDSKSQSCEELFLKCPNKKEFQKRCFQDEIDHVGEVAELPTATEFVEQENIRIIRDKTTPEKRYKHRTVTRMDHPTFSRSVSVPNDIKVEKAQGDQRFSRQESMPDSCNLVLPPGASGDHVKTEKEPWCVDIQYTTANFDIIPSPNTQDPTSNEQSVSPGEKISPLTSSGIVKVKEESSISSKINQTQNNNVKPQTYPSLNVRSYIPPPPREILFPGPRSPVPYSVPVDTRVINQIAQSSPDAHRSTSLQDISNGLLNGHNKHLKGTSSENSPCPSVPQNTPSSANPDLTKNFEFDVEEVVRKVGLLDSKESSQLCKMGNSLSQQDDKCLIGTGDKTCDSQANKSKTLSPTVSSRSDSVTTTRTYSDAWSVPLMSQSQSVTLPKKDSPAVRTGSIKVEKSTSETKCTVSLHTASQKEVWELDNNNNTTELLAVKTSKESKPVEKVAAKIQPKEKGLNLKESPPHEASSSETKQEVDLIKQYLTSNKVLKMVFSHKFGRKGTGDKETLAFPIGVTITANKQIIVCDNGNSLVKVFSWEGAHLLSIGELAVKTFYRPSAAVSNKEGDIFVKDDKQIQVFNKEGKFLRAFGKEVLHKPFGLAITNKGHIVTVDTPSHSAKVVIFHQNGNLLKAGVFEPLLTDVMRQAKCRFITVFDDKLYVVDLGKSVVYITTLDGKTVKTFGNFGSKPGFFKEPSGITVDRFGNLFIADSKNNRIQLFTPEGELQCVLGPMDILRPSDITITDQGELVVVNYLQHCVKIFKLAR